MQGVGATAELVPDKGRAGRGACSTTDTMLVLALEALEAVKLGSVMLDTSNDPKLDEAFVAGAE